MAAKTCEVEVWVMVDENGDYAVSASESDLGDAYDNAISSGSDVARRIVKVRLTVPVPQTVELTGVVVDDEESPVLTAAT